MAGPKTRNIVLSFVLIIAISPFFLIASFLFYKKRKVTNELIKNYALLKKEAFEQAVSGAGIQLQKNAFLFSQTTEVREFFSEYNNDTTSLDIAARKFDKLFANKTKLGEQRALFSDYQVQLFVPPARNVYKSWDGSIGEDVSLLRKSIIHVNAFQTPEWALELGKTGFNLRGIAPVSSKNGYMFSGTVELFASLEDILKSLSGDDEYWAVYLPDKYFRLIRKKDRETSVDFHRAGRFVFLFGETYKFDSSILDPNEFESLLNSEDDAVAFSNIDDKWNMAFAIKDFSKKNIAIAVLQTSETIVERVVPQFLEAALIISILLLFVLLSLLARNLTRRVEVKGFAISVPMFFGFFMEYIEIRKALFKLNWAIKDIAHALEGFLIKKDFAEISVTNPLYKQWVAIRSSIEDEKRQLNSLNEALKEKDWLTQASRELDMILHEDYRDLKDLMNQVLKVFIQKMNCVAGAIYLVDEENEELTRYITYVGKYYFGQEEIIKFGDGVAGACAMEKKRVVLSEVPERYFEIASGLGQTIPKHVVLEPLVSRGTLFGIIELASLPKFAEQAMQFLKLSTEQVAVRVSIFQSSRKALQLLKQAEEKSLILKQTEQQLEELSGEHHKLQAAFGDLSNRSGFIDNMLWESLLYMEYDHTGRIKRVNDRWAELLNHPKSHILQGSFYDGIEFDNFEYQNQKKFWESLKDGTPKQRVKTYSIQGRELNLNEVFQGILAEEELTRVIRIAFVV